MRKTDTDALISLTIKQTYYKCDGIVRPNGEASSGYRLVRGQRGVHRNRPAHGTRQDRPHRQVATGASRRESDDVYEPEERERCVSKTKLSW
jgi:hypothetical protein